MKLHRLAAAVFVSIGPAVWAGQLPQSADPQTPTPTFKAEVEYVEVDALVVDERGQFVRDLKREDFQVFEDGKPQKIATFALVDIPAEPIERGPAALDPVEPDVQSSDKPFTGRMYVVILDDLQTAPLRTQLMKAAARQFIERSLSANDLMAIVNTSGRTNAAQDFTSSRRLLLAAVDRAMGQKLESATLARNEEFFRGSTTGRVSDPLDMERGFNAQSTLRSIRQVAEWLGGVRGRRKSIVLISEGIDYDITDVFNNRSASSVIDATRDAIGAATRSNVTIYALDPRGMTGFADTAIEVGVFADQSAGARTTDDGTVQQAPGINSGSLQNEFRLAQDSLRTIADETNGFAAVNSNDVTSMFERIVTENSTYYVLAYYPASTRRDGRFHRIEVRTSRPGVRIRARRGYVAPRGTKPGLRMTGNDGASPMLLEALNSPLPASGIAMRVFAAPFKGVAPNASVVLGIELGGRDLAFAKDERVELSYVAVDGSAKIRAGDTDLFTLTLPEDTQSRVEQHGLRILKRLAVPPGRYQLRIAVRNSASGALGALSYDLDVPDFEQQRFSMSGLLLTSKAGTVTVTARGDEQLMKVMPAPPVSLRRFPQGDEITVLAEIYDRAGNAPHVVDIATVVRSRDGAVRFQSSDERSSAEAQGAGRHVYTSRVPTSGLQPGRYVLTVEARSRLGDTASRQIPFDVVP